MDMMTHHVTAEEYISPSVVMVMIARGREGEEVSLYHYEYAVRYIIPRRYSVM